MSGAGHGGRTATWWTPTGWLREPGPPYWNLVAKEGGVDELRSRCGYQPIREFSSDATWLLQPEVWRHPEFGLHVTLWSGDRGVSEYFVQVEHEDIFMAVEFPRLLETGLRELQNDLLAKIAKTLTAFARHGTGRDTISADGEWSLDDERHYARSVGAQRAGAKAA